MKEHNKLLSQRTDIHHCLLLLWIWCILFVLCHPVALKYSLKVILPAVPGSSYSSLPFSFQLSAPNLRVRSLLHRACHVPTNFCRHPINVRQVILSVRKAIDTAAYMCCTLWISRYKNEENCSIIEGVMWQYQPHLCVLTDITATLVLRRPVTVSLLSDAFAVAFALALNFWTHLQ